MSGCLWLIKRRRRRRRGWDLAKLLERLTVKCRSSQLSCPPTQRNLRGGKWSSTEKILKIPHFYIFKVDVNGFSSFLPFDYLLLERRGGYSHLWLSLRARKKKPTLMSPVLKLIRSSIIQHRQCAADFSLLNLPKGKSLGRSKPATNS